MPPCRSVKQPSAKVVLFNTAFYRIKEMEIETATQRTLSALTLSEKSLARDLLTNEQYRELSGTVRLN